MKRLLTTMALGSALVMAVLPARAEVGTISFGITNAIGANATTSANLGNAVKVDGQDNCSLMLKFQGDGSGTGAVTVTLARSPDNSNWETTPKWSFATALNNTTAVVFWTNMPAAQLGAAGYVKVTSIVNADATINGTNASLYLVKKTIKAAP
jgi:hypothetical protein